MTRKTQEWQSRKNDDGTTLITTVVQLDVIHAWKWEKRVIIFLVSFCSGIKMHWQEPRANMHIPVGVVEEANKLVFISVRMPMKQEPFPSIVDVEAEILLTHHHPVILVIFFMLHEYLASFMSYVINKCYHQLSCNTIREDRQNSIPFSSFSMQRPCTATFDETDQRMVRSLLRYRLLLLHKNLSER